MTTSIPKILHYCWFGEHEMPDNIQQCLTSWQFLKPEYQFICWNESNFDVSRYQFTKEAYEQKKWAFVADFARLEALYQYGGIYLDTDVMMLRSFDHLLNSYQLVLGSDEFGGIITSFMAATPQHPYINECLSIYQNKSFIKATGKLDMTINNVVMNNLLRSHYKINHNTNEELGLIIYPDDYFQVKSFVSGKLHLTENSCMIHHMNKSWDSVFAKILELLRTKILVPIIGTKAYVQLNDFVRRLVSHIRI
ncbi:glycosyltransferase family 32 protein [Microbacter margulisiae]|uniref:Mannosyltransferase OCH1-like enzyme n=1 Tax=Microbacter margulisiae TaxID=1350067 RepID=A0A7W5DNR2_9PORP|nr:glycosyltransferase [Microbacter margulisiae]MBB3185985.1 mannosyltransferase OCH1-like enzyme [Microbacter margulisiae]